MYKTASQIADTVLAKLAASFGGVSARANKAFGDLDRATARPTPAPKPAAVPPTAKAPAPAQVTKPVKAPAPAPTAMKPAPQVKTPPVMKPQAPTQVQKPVQKPAVMKPAAPVQAPAAMKPTPSAAAAVKPVRRPPSREFTQLTNTHKPSSPLYGRKGLSLSHRMKILREHNKKNPL